MRGLNSLGSYKNKIAGLVILSAGLLTAIIWKIHPFTIIPKYDSDKHLSVLLWVIVLGMYLTAFSQEKYEDERVKMIRARSLQTSMMLMTGTIIAFSLTAITQNIGDLDVTLLLMMPAVYLGIYLAIFHVGLYYDNLWDYEEKKLSFRENWRKNRKPLLIFKLISFAVLILVYLLLS